MMDFFDAAMLSRFQFAFTVAYHFLFVPMSIGLGLIMALAQTRAYKTRLPKDAAAAHFWVKVFTITFAVGVATGITMEFAFGTNWANYSRFVGDIFGAPLAAEALLAFFLESTFLGIILFGKKKVSPRFYLVSSWLVWAGSCLSALWILIANSWMQTPAGYEVAQTASGAKAVITDFWAAALNPSIAPRYLHTVDALLIFGAFVAIAIGAYHMLHGKKEFGRTTLKVSTIVAIVTILIMMPAAHMQAVEVANYQPEKLAAMEGQYEAGPVNMSIVGYVDESGQKVVGIDVPIQGMTSLLASGSTETSYPGLNNFAEGDTPPVQPVFQTYHIMVVMFGLIMLFLIAAIVVAFRKHKKPCTKLLKFLMWAPVAPIIAIECGWMVTEIGRQPWIVWHELRTADAISQAVPVPELLITIALFIIVYAFIFVMYARIVLKVIKTGPVLDETSDGPLDGGSPLYSEVGGESSAQGNLNESSPSHAKRATSDAVDGNQIGGAHRAQGRANDTSEEAK
ncbi:MAG: cytochrome ubiquinol oxidase subunit I [Eggerthellaceae bacterium]|jgi:cytochrome d ubiquinol oxidase subunit I|nr:cytochrome ubiquinol oxidase subunit I [Eggerthellaceae bacterium]MCH4221678.1 cytochrome ubiquinol oxidase subunit I [Eggerthellaceae bacterium]